MTITRIDAEIEVWQITELGFKPRLLTPMQYTSGQSNPPVTVLRIANRYNYPVGADLCSESGRLKFTLATAYWQSNKLQAKEVRNADPHSTGMDTTLDGAYADLHNFTVESIGCGGYRDVLVKLNGVGLTFADALEAVTVTFPSGA